ncbi:MAG: peptide chain release factor N(5)-glutamine methyltransferase [Myxococcota bacterium]
MSNPPTLVDVLTRTDAYLRERGVDSPRLDAELLVGHVLGIERLQVYMQFDRPMGPDELDQLRALVRRRGGREPMAYILGERGFHAVDLLVDADVLVPRPDTETLVEAALEFIPDGEGEPIFVADIGCGTGAVGLAVAMARPRVRLFSVDLSDAALANTKKNVARLELTDRVAVLKGHLLDPIPTSRPIDWVLSNPPYIPTADLDGLMPEVSVHEPRLALDGGLDGLDVIRELVRASVPRARLGLLLELGKGQHEDVMALMMTAGLQNVRAWNDLGGIGRVVGGVKAQSTG